MHPHAREAIAMHSRYIPIQQLQHVEHLRFAYSAVDAYASIRQLQLSEYSRCVASSYSVSCNPIHTADVQ